MRVLVCDQYSKKLAYRTVRAPLMVRGAKSTEEQILDIKILDCYNVKPLIYRGEQAKLKEFPHMVILTNFSVEYLIFQKVEHIAM